LCLRRPLLLCGRAARGWGLPRCGPGFLACAASLRCPGFGVAWCCSSPAWLLRSCGSVVPRVAGPWAGPGGGKEGVRGDLGGTLAAVGKGAPVVPPLGAGGPRSLDVDFDLAGASCLCHGFGLRCVGSSLAWCGLCHGFGGVLRGFLASVASCLCHGFGGWCAVPRQPGACLCHGKVLTLTLILTLILVLTCRLRRS
jgi:hypothetical protein